MARNLKFARRAPSKGGDAPQRNTRQTEEPDLQREVGNAEVQQMLQGNDEFRLPSEMRARLASDSELLLIAASTFSESEQSDRMTEEMLALATVATNQLEHAATADDELFGSAAARNVLSDKEQFEEYGQSSYQTFWEALRFDKGFESSEQLQHAKAAIQAAEEIQDSGNPFQHEFMTFSDSSEARVMGERIDDRTRVQYGQNFFWALSKDPTVLAALGEDEEEESLLGVAEMGGTDEPE